MKANWKRDAILFLLSEAISLFGSMLVQYAIMWHITLSTKSGMMMTLSILCGFLPMFFLSPFAGVWADRYPRKTLIILSDASIALATLLLAVLYLLGFESIWLLLLVSAIRSLGTAVQTPAVSAMLPQIVPEDKLMKVNGLNSSIQSVIALLSPLLSGALLTLSSIEAVFFIDVATAVIAIVVLMLFLRVPAHQRAQQTPSGGHFADMREGFSYIKSHRFVLLLFLFSAFYFVLVSPLAFLTPLQVTRSFGDDVWRLTAIEVVYSAGMVLGGVLVAFWGGFKNKIHSIGIANLASAALTIALGLIPNFVLYLLFMGLIGLLMPAFQTPYTVLIQTKVSEQFMGRVFSVLSMIPNLVMPLAMLFYGPIADVLRIEWLLLITGSLMLILGLSILTNKTLLKEGVDTKPANMLQEPEPDLSK